MSPGTAASFQHKPFGVRGGADIPTHGHLGAPLDQRGGGRPVILYSHGFTTDRSLGTVLVEDLASRGYVVVTIDHTHDAGEVEFPDGRIANSAVPVSSDTEKLWKTMAKAAQVRSGDARYVLDQLTAINRGQHAGRASRRRGATHIHRRLLRPLPAPPPQPAAAWPVSGLSGSRTRPVTRTATPPNISLCVVRRGRCRTTSGCLRGRGRRIRGSRTRYRPVPGEPGRLPRWLWRRARPDRR